jgi:hypothetical protein
MADLKKPSPHKMGVKVSQKCLCEGINNSLAHYLLAFRLTD